jgi:hypothetical protein
MVVGVFDGALSSVIAGMKGGDPRMKINNGTRQHRIGNGIIVLGPEYWKIRFLAGN